MKHLIVALVAILALAGCAATKPNDPNAPPSNANDQLVAASADAGAILCAAGMVDIKPADLAKLRGGLVLANAVLGEQQPSVGELTRAIQEAFPTKYAGVAAAAIRRLNARLNNAQTLNRDTVGFQVASVFVRECSLAVGSS